MSDPDFGQSPHSADHWPPASPSDLPDYQDPAADMPVNDTQYHPEWAEDEVTPDEPEDRDGARDDPAPSWPGSGTYVTAGAHQPGEHHSYRPTPGHPASHHPALRSLSRVLVLVALLIAAVTVVVLPRSHLLTVVPADSPGAGQSAAITRKQAEQVMAHFWTVNNQANEQRSDGLLGTIEAGSSYSLDTGAYRFYRASDLSGASYVPITAAHTSYYIPWQSAHAAYPHWFAAAVTYADLASPHHLTGTGYLVFSQASPGAPWKDVAEPITLAGRQSLRIATNAKGYATQVSPSSNTGSLAIAPAQAGQETAAALNAPATAAIELPGSLADQTFDAYGQSLLPAGSTDSDRHQATPGPVFGLRTTDGGAILFYTVAAQVTLAPPPGQTFELDIPGYYSPGQPLASADAEFTEQFATYDPPQGKGRPDVVADVSNITGS